MKTTQFNMQPYIYKISVWVGTNDIEAFEKYISDDMPAKTVRKLIKDIRGHKNGASACYSMRDDYIVIFFYDKDNYSLYEVIPHEVFHAVMAYLGILGLKYSRKSEEAYSYLFGYFCSIIFQELLKSDATI